MKLILQRLMQDSDESFIVYHEKEPFFSCPWHYHPEYELVLILKSTGKRIIGDHVGDFMEGDLVFIGSGLPHVYDNTTTDTYIEADTGLEAEALVVQFLPDLLGRKFLHLPEFKRLKKMLEKAQQGVCITGETRDKVAAQMVEMHQTKGMSRLIGLLSIFAILSKSTEYELLASPGFMHNFENSATERYRHITEYIMKNFSEEIPLATIADVANMTTTYFCTFFKNYYGQTFVEYLNNIRIGYACKLLGSTEKNIADIAMESGFNNISNFNRQFRKVKDITPAEYRRSLSVKLQKTRKK